MLMAATKRPGPPTLEEIVGFWAKSDQFALLFPHAEPLAIGWAEPCCFRCGWLVPISEAINYTPARWRDARGWLERCHLHDHAHGGSSELDNFVLLCALCHREQPECPTLEAGVAFVNSRSIRRRALQPLVQIYTDGRYAGRRPEDTQEGLRLLQKAYAECGAIFAQLAGGFR